MDQSNLFQNQTSSGNAEACLRAGRHDIPGQQKHRKQKQPKQCVRNEFPHCFSPFTQVPIKKRSAPSFSEPFAIFMIYCVHLGWNKLWENRAGPVSKQ